MPEHQQIQQSKKTNTIFQKQTTPVVQTPVSNPYSIIQRAKVNPRSLTRADIMQLQRTIGNQAVGRLLSSIGSSSTVQQVTVQRQEIPEEEEPLQGKMIEPLQLQEIPEEEEPLQGKMIGTVQRQEIPEEEEPLQGKFEDKPEIACPSCFAAPLVQRQAIPEEEEPLQGKMIETIQRQETPEEEEPLQGKFKESIQRQEIPEDEEPLQGKTIENVQRQEIPEEESPMQGKFPNSGQVTCTSCSAASLIQKQEIPEEEEPLQTKRENNTGMPDNLKAGVENLSGIDMNDVKVHYNSSKPAEVGALAYTQGTDIHVAPGQEKHLPHEAWHVVQQKQGRVKPTMQMKALGINDDPSLEHEADMMGVEMEQLNALTFSQGVDIHVGPGQERYLPHEPRHVMQQNINTNKISLVQRMKCKANIKGKFKKDFYIWDFGEIEGEEAKNGNSCNSTLQKLPQTSHITSAVGAQPHGLNNFRLSSAGTCAEPHAVAKAIDKLLDLAKVGPKKPTELMIDSLIVKEAEPTRDQAGHWLYNRWITAQKRQENQVLDKAKLEEEMAQLRIRFRTKGKSPAEIEQKVKEQKENFDHERDADAYYSADGYEAGLLKSPPAARRCPVCAEWMKTDTWEDVEVPLKKGFMRLRLSEES